MKNSLLVIFGEIWPMTLYYSTGPFAQFLLKKFVKNLILIGISSKFLHNINTCIHVCIRKNCKNEEFSPNHFWQNLANDPVL